MQPLNRYWKICTIQTLLPLPQSTQDYFDQVLSPPPMDLDFLDNLESLPVAEPDGQSMPMDFNDFMTWADTSATVQPESEKDLNAAPEPVVEKDVNAAIPPVVEKDVNAATQPIAKKDLKRMLLNEDDCAKRVVPAARKDLSKMFDEPIHPDTSQSTNMPGHTEDFLLLEEGELDYEELDDTESPSTTCSGLKDNAKRSSTFGSGSTNGVRRSSTFGSCSTNGVRRSSTFGSSSSDSVKRPSTSGSGSSDSVKRPSTYGSGSSDSAKPIQQKRVITIETEMKKTSQDHRPASPIRRPSLERTPPPATPMRRRMPPHPYKENRFVLRNPTPSYRRNLFPNHNVQKYFHTKTLYCLAIRKNGFTLSNGSLSTSVDNDAEWKETLKSLLLQKNLNSLLGGLLHEK